MAKEYCLRARTDQMDDMGFTDAQKDIITLLAKGFSIEEVAKIRNVSQQTIKNIVSGSIKAEEIGILRLKRMPASELGIMGIIQLKTGRRPNGGSVLLFLRELEVLEDDPNVVAVADPLNPSKKFASRRKIIK